MGSVPARLPGERRTRQRARLGLLVAGLFASFAAGELYVRWRIEGGFLPAVASIVGARVRRDVPQGARLLLDGDLGYRLNPAFPGVNSFGFRGPEIPPGPHPGVTRLLVLGDSVAFDEGGFPDLLRERLASGRARTVEVFNASVPGYTTHQERVFFERRLAPLEPDLVLLAYCLNDNHRFLHRIGPDGERLMTPEARRALLATEGGWLAHLTDWSYLAIEVRRRVLLRRLAAAARAPWEAREDLCTAWQDESWTPFAAELSALRAAVRRGGGRLVVAAFPIESQLDPAKLAADRGWTLKPQRCLARACEETGVRLLDLFEEFRSAGERGLKPFRDEIHLSPAGHALGAEVLATRLGL